MRGEDGGDLGSIQPVMNNADEQQPRTRSVRFSVVVVYFVCAVACEVAFSSSVEMGVGRGLAYDA